MRAKVENYLMYLATIIVVSFIGIGFVKADTQCSYLYGDDALGHNSNTAVTITNAGEVTAWVNVFNGSKATARASVMYTSDFGWKKDSSGNYYCPTYMLLAQSSAWYDTEFTVYFSNSTSSIDKVIDKTYSDSKNDTGKIQTVSLTNQSGTNDNSNIDEQSKTDAQNKLSSYTSDLKAFCTDDTYSDCKKDTANCPLCSCQDNYKSDLVIIDSKYNEIKTFVSDGYIANNTTEYNNFNTAYNDAKTRCNNLLNKVTATISTYDSSTDNNSDTGTTVSGCADLLGPNVVNLLTTIFKMIQIIGPIAALGLGMYDMLQALASGEDDAKKKAFKKLGKRIAAAVLLLLLPYIINFILSLIPSLKGSNCLNI